MTAPTLDELWDRIAKLQHSIQRLLELSAEGDIPGYLRERGIPFEAVDEAHDQGSPVQLPFLVRVKAS